MWILDGEVLRRKIADQRQVDCEVSLREDVPVLVGEREVGPQRAALQVHRGLARPERVSAQRKEFLAQIYLLLVLCCSRGLLIDVVEKGVVVEHLGWTPGR